MLRSRASTCASGVWLTGWMQPRMSRSGRGPPSIARVSSRWLGCSADSRSQRRATRSGSEAGVPLNRKRGSFSDQRNHAALRTRWPSGRLKPMDNTVANARHPLTGPPPGSSYEMSSNSDGLWPRNMPEGFRPRGSDGTWSGPAAQSRQPCSPGMFGGDLSCQGRPGDLLVVPDACPGLEAAPASSAPGTAPTGHSASPSHLRQGAPPAHGGMASGARSRARPGTAG